MYYQFQRSLLFRRAGITRADDPGQTITVNDLPHHVTKNPITKGNGDPLFVSVGESFKKFACPRRLVTKA